MEFKHLVEAAEKWCSGNPFDLIFAEEDDERRLDFYAEPGVSFYVLCPGGTDSFVSQPLQGLKRCVYVFMCVCVGVLRLGRRWGCPGWSQLMDTEEEEEKEGKREGGFGRRMGDDVILIWIHTPHPLTVCRCCFSSIITKRDNLENPTHHRARLPQHKA